MVELLLTGNSVTDYESREAVISMSDEFGKVREGMIIRLELEFDDKHGIRNRELHIDSNHEGPSHIIDQDNKKILSYVRGDAPLVRAIIDGGYGTGSLIEFRGFKWRVLEVLHN